jgi:type IV secretion system protein VirB6
MFLEDIITRVDSVLETYSADAYQSLVAQYGPAIFALLTMYFVFMGYRLLTGTLEVSGSDMFKSMLTISACVMVGTEWDFFVRYIYDFVTNAPSEVATVMVSAVPDMDTQTDGIGLLSEFFNGGLKVAAQAWEGASLLSVSQVLLAFCIFIFTILGTFSAFCFILLSKITLALALALAPIFVLLFMFQPTRGMFDGWLRVTVTAMLIPLFIYAMIGLVYATMFEILDAIISKSEINAADTFALISIMATEFVLFTASGTMAGSVAGGAAVSLRGPIHATLNSVKSGWRAGKMTGEGITGTKQVLGKASGYMKKGASWAKSRVFREW